MKSLDLVLILLAGWRDFHGHEPRFSALRAGGLDDVRGPASRRVSRNTSFSCARVVLRIEVEDDRLAAQLREADGLPLVGLELEVRCRAALRNHQRERIGCIDPWKPCASRTATPT